MVHFTKQHYADRPHRNPPAVHAEVALWAEFTKACVDDIIELLDKDVTDIDSPEGYRETSMVRDYRSAVRAIFNPSAPTRPIVKMAGIDMEGIQHRLFTLLQGHKHQRAFIAHVAQERGTV